ncbi:mitochondrial ribosomal large subunit component [Puccinia graminis f. sp. tritici]|uniref:Mitochondrial ribosomal large subunit component n=1 Tax=Puccinia graminis f. sp. tritici TaxID=56615 RepID=A0A5B0PFU8_PUCGR|nr:mitochondrial ribosomal large subunit component [Puccinia graminis f. sp. tritici]KAA1123496.1 mitochondrial ribosomal large subunit component [Puccinia graminis f. sp. tritici]
MFNFRTNNTPLQIARRMNPIFNPQQQQRNRSDLAPKKFKYRKAFKGSTPIRTGGSTVATTLEHGQFGLRVLEPCRLSAKTLQSCETAIKRAIKPTKGAQCYLRVFPDLPVCVKGNETRMGKGKGPFEYWACRAPVGRVLFEVGGGGIQKEMAFAALQHAKPRLPVKSEFIHLDSKARLGGILVEKPMDTKKRIRLSSSSSSSSALNDSPTAIISKLLDQVRLSRSSSSLTKLQ